VADADDPFLTMTVEDVCRLAWDYHVEGRLAATGDVVRYGDRTQACAVFVRHELASIAGVGPLPE
jgi:hypothetical protein